jgi:hypothetical protein
MPMIDTDHLKHGLLPVQRAEAVYEAAVATLQATDASDFDGMAAARATLENAERAFDRACLGLYGYVGGAVKDAEAKAEAAKKTNPR